MKKATLFNLSIILLLIVGCNERSNQQARSSNKITVTDTQLPNITVAKKAVTPIFKAKMLEINNVLINGHKVILPINEFNKLYKKIDSTQTDLWECGNPLDWLDQKWMIKTYGKYNKEKGMFEHFDGKITTLFAKDIEFTTNNHIVLFNTAFAKSNTFKIISHQIVLDKNTSLSDFKKIFPTAVMEKLETPDEVRFRFSIAKDADDAFLFCFKNGKLDYFTLWWLLC